MKKEPDILHTVQYVNRNIVTIQKIQQTHRRQMANMCFWNVDFANRIIKKYMISGSYDALSGKMVWLDTAEKGEEGKNQALVEQVWNLYFYWKNEMVSLNRTGRYNLLTAVNFENIVQENLRYLSNYYYETTRRGDVSWWIQNHFEEFYSIQSSILWGNRNCLQKKIVFHNQGHHALAEVLGQPEKIFEISSAVRAVRQYIENKQKNQHIVVLKNLLGQNKVQYHSALQLSYQHFDAVKNIRIQKSVLQGINALHTSVREMFFQNIFKKNIDIRKILSQQTNIQNADIREVLSRQENNQNTDIRITAFRQINKKKIIDGKIAFQQINMQNTGGRTKNLQQTSVQKAGNRVTNLQKIDVQNIANKVTSLQQISVQNTGNRVTNLQQIDEQKTGDRTTVLQQINRQNTDRRKTTMQQVSTQNAEIQESELQEVSVQQKDAKQAVVQEFSLTEEMLFIKPVFTEESAVRESFTGSRQKNNYYTKTTQRGIASWWIQNHFKEVYSIQNNAVWKNKEWLQKEIVFHNQGYYALTAVLGQTEKKLEMNRILTVRQNIENQQKVQCINVLKNLLEHNKVRHHSALRLFHQHFDAMRNIRIQESVPEINAQHASRMEIVSQQRNKQNTDIRNIALQQLNIQKTDDSTTVLKQVDVQNIDISDTAIKQAGVQNKRTQESRIQEIYPIQRNVIWKNKDWLLEKIVFCNRGYHALTAVLGQTEKKFELSSAIHTVRQHIDTSHQHLGSVKDISIQKLVLQEKYILQTSIRKIVFQQINKQNTDIRDITLPQVNIQNADTTLVVLQQMNVQKADAKATALQQINIHKTDARTTESQQINIQKADVNTALQQANIQTAVMQQVRTQDINIGESIFQRINIKNTKIQETMEWEASASQDKNKESIVQELSVPYSGNKEGIAQKFSVLQDVYKKKKEQKYSSGYHHFVYHFQEAGYDKAKDTVSQKPILSATSLSGNLFEEYNQYNEVVWAKAEKGKYQSEKKPSVWQQGRMLYYQSGRSGNSNIEQRQMQNLMAEVQQQLRKREEIAVQQKQQLRQLEEKLEQQEKIIETLTEEQKQRKGQADVEDSNSRFTRRKLFEAELKLEKMRYGIE